MSAAFDNGLPEPIPNELLTLARIPLPSATWEEISVFALTFDGYRENGSNEKCAEIANERRHNSLSDLRTCLFFEQRRWHHFGDDPDAEAMAYIKSLLRQIWDMVVEVE